MQLGEVIRKYRKSKNLTQEAMASRLGVTAPAVNKWENGNSFPDIMLLAPIARLLGISLDTLLSFQEELTQEEINEIIQKVDLMIKEKPYEEAFHWAKEIVEQYPNCCQLIWQIAVIFDAHFVMQGLSGQMEYERYIVSWYHRALECDKEEVRVQAADSLVGFYMRKGEYDKAEGYLEYFSPQNPDRKRKQAQIYSETNRIPEAYQAYEEILFSSYQMVNATLHGMYQLALQEHDMGWARKLVEKQSELARCFEMGKYYEVSCQLELASLERDEEATLAVMEGMLENVGQVGRFQESALFQHMKFREVRKEFREKLREDLRNCFRDEEAFGFLKSNKKWQQMQKGD
ncbi:helix-turn-helix transcriptional regulator [Lachnospiraceae bacterium 29-84]